MPRAIIAAILSLAVFLTGCCTDPVNGESYFCFGEVSDQEEAAMGAEYAPSFIAESGGIYPDPALHSYLNEIVIDKLAKRSHRPDLPWEFHILNTSQINAFALPGGQVFVTRGLLSKLENEAQFAHLMGHEVGHVTHRHSVRGQGRAAIFSVLVGLVSVAEEQLLDPETPHLITPAVAGVGQLTILKFSRDQELQSDRRGVDYAVAAGYDPLEGKKTFELFLSLKGGGESMIEGLMSTHPLDSARIDQIDKYVAKAHPDRPNGLAVNSTQFGGLLASVRNAQTIYEKHDEAMAMVAQAQKDNNLGALDTAETMLRQCANELPGHAAFSIGLGAIALTRNDNTGAERHFDKAISLQPNLFMGSLYRGVARENLQRLGPAKQDFERAHSIHNAHPLPCYLMGKIAETENRPADATTWYQRAMERSPAESSIHTKAKEKLEALQAGSPA